MQFISRLQYRAALWGGLTINLFYGFVHVVIISTFYSYGAFTGTSQEAGMTMQQAVSYAWLVQLLIHMLPSMSADNEVREKIKNGDVGIELCRPLDLYAHWYTRAMATRIAALTQRVVFMVALAMVLPEPYRLQPPASLQGLIAALVALAMGIALSCAVVGVVYVMLMRITWGDGPVLMVFTAIDILSGAYLPLQLWPTWAQRLLLLQPFAGLIDIPLRLYVGTMEPTGLWQALAVQVAWFVVLVLLGRASLRRNLAQLVIQGG